MWMVSGTTRNVSLASIITARRAPVRWARNSVWPGKAKPAAFSTALWMGAVTSAAASPSRQAAHRDLDGFGDGGGIGGARACRARAATCALVGISASC